MVYSLSLNYQVFPRKLSCSCSLGESWVSDYIRKTTLNGFLCQCTDVGFLVSDYLAAVFSNNLGNNLTIL